MQKLIEELGRLPGIGERSAERIAFHLLTAAGEEVESLLRAIEQARTRLARCGVCQNLGDQDPCGICRDPSRDATVVCVVEQPADLWALEKTGVFRGLYHVLLGRIAPLDGVGPEQLTVDKLIERVRQGSVKEIILATNPTLEGDGTCLHLHEMLSAFPVRITRLARGIPSGSSIEQLSRSVLAEALQGRRNLSHDGFSR